MKTILMTILILFILGICIILGLNAYVKNYSKGSIIYTEEAAKLESVDCILVLGCSVKADGTPSDVLADRIKKSVELYNAGVSDVILMSGDHGSADYNEVGTMKKVAVESGVPSEDVFLDHAGFATYDSMYRAKEVFNAKKIVIVSQDFHLYRSIYIARQLGMEAYGVAADYRAYFGQTYYDVREILARCKDFVKVKIRPESTYVGEPISLNGNGDDTNG